MIHGHLEKIGYCSMKIGSIWKFEKWTRITSWRSTNLRKVEIAISIHSKVMSQIIMVFHRVFICLTLCTTSSKISLLMFSIPVFDAKLNSACNGSDFKEAMRKKYGSLFEIIRFQSFPASIQVRQKLFVRFYFGSNLVKTKAFPDFIGIKMITTSCIIYTIKINIIDRTGVEYELSL